MKFVTNPALEKRARDMFEDSRRGVQLSIQWPSLSEEDRGNWRLKAHQIEKAIADSLAKKKLEVDGEL